MTPPRKELEMQIIDNQQDCHFKLLESLFRLGGGWFANTRIGCTLPLPYPNRMSSAHCRKSRLVKIIFRR